VIADFEVQVGGAAFDGAAQEIVNIDGHGTSLGAKSFYRN
jgi:hypothetical protein